MEHTNGCQIVGGGYGCPGHCQTHRFKQKHRLERLDNGGPGLADHVWTVEELLAAKI